MVDLEFDAFGSWNDVHAIEVKPYWAVNRSALFEAAAQAALRRCSFSWLLAWGPALDPQHFRPNQLRLIADAEAVLDDLAKEANSLGLGMLLARSLTEETELESLAQPVRQPMEPRSANALFRSLGRSDSAHVSEANVILEQ